MQLIEARIYLASTSPAHYWTIAIPYVLAVAGAYVNMVSVSVCESVLTAHDDL